MIIIIIIIINPPYPNHTPILENLSFWNFVFNFLIQVQNEKKLSFHTLKRQF